MLDLFDKTVVPVLLYGCEVWGYENNIAVDMVFLKFCKYLLGKAAILIVWSMENSDHTQFLSL